MNYYIAKNNEKDGPYTETELSAQHITGDTLVWAEGMENWQEARTIPALAPYIVEPQPEIPLQPKSYLVESILVTIFCCLPFGIVGIVKAASVGEKYNAGNYAEAEIASQDAKKWMKLGLFVGLAVGIIYLIVYCFIFLAAINDKL